VAPEYPDHELMKNHMRFDLGESVHQKHKMQFPKALALPFFEQVYSEVSKGLQTE
jgi:hypothetical protein